MTIRHRHDSGTFRARHLVPLLFPALLALSPASTAQLTQIANSPLASTTSAEVKPNIMFLFDTSGSMDSLDMPDSMGSYTTRIGYKNFLCNSVYYNPSITYLPPKRSDGSNFTAASFTGAYSNGYQNYPSAPSSTAINLSTSFKAHGSDTSQPAYYYLYTGAQALDYSVSACTSDSDPNSTSTYDTNIAATGGGNWQKKKVTSTSGPGSTDERENFANWYQYYRSRLMLAKAAASRSFNQLSTSYRVGMITITPMDSSGSVDAAQYVPISDFNSGQRTSWFTKLFSQSTHDSTPLREALARVGRHYAGKTDGINTGMSGDPVQYSCQQNFTILATDGYWNTGDEIDGPVGIDGSTLVGQQDGTIATTPRPFWDGAASLETTTFKSNTYNANVVCNTARQRRDQQVQKRTAQHQTRTTQIQQRTTQIQQRTRQIQQRTTQVMQRTVQNQQRTQQLQRRTVQNQRRIVQRQKRTVTSFVSTSTTTNATFSMVISGVTNGTTVSAVNINGVDVMAGSVTASGGTTASRITTVVNYMAANIGGGFSVYAFGACAGTNNPVPNCASGRSYVAAMAAAASGTTIASAAPATTLGTLTATTTFSSVGVNTTTSLAGPSVGSCTAGTTITGNTRVVTSCSSTDTGFQNIDACAASSGGGVTVTCQTASDTGFVNIGTCVASNPVGTGPTTTCQVASDTGMLNLAATSCTASNPASGPTVTCNTTDTGFVNIGTCTATTPVGGFNASGTQITCQVTSDSGFINATTCSASNPAAGPTITCQTTDTGFVNASSCSASSGGGQTITCQTTDTGFVNASSCSASSGSGQTITCQTTDTGFVNAATCTPNGGPTGGLTITCQTTDTGFVNSTACTPSAAGGQTVTCQITSDTGFANAASCTAANSGSGPTVTCQTTDSGWYNVATCSNSSSGGLTVTCQTNLAGKKITYTTTTSTSSLNLNTGATTTGGPTTGSAQNYDGVCYAGGNGMPTPPANGTPAPTENPTPPAGCSAWPCTTTSTSGGSSNSLADVAQYYYATDLRPSLDNNVPAGGTGPEDDKATWQHMTTFTMGLGLAGTLNYQSNYKTANTGDFQDIRDGVKIWPVPSANDPTALDDLWHAAVNGRGQFFSAADPDKVVQSLNTALSGITARVSSAAAAATSNLEPVAGDNFAYTAKYRTVEWNGELEAHEIDLSTGEVKAAVVWSAQSQLDARTGNYCDNRTIYLFRAGATSNRTTLTWNTKACDSSMLATGTATTGLNAAEQAYFSSTQVAQLGQYPSMTDGSGTPATDDQRTAAVGDKLLNFVRGQRGYENFTINDAEKLYRLRTHVLGDIVNAQPVYVKAPFAAYTDTGYSTFKTANASRTPMVYVAANDGMLHAFKAGTSTSDPDGGNEAWAFVPSMVLPNLYKLADSNYANNHAFNVDGTPTVGDFYDTNAGAWKTMLVAGLNAGGKGYYALDITDAANPKGLWEFKWSDTCYDATDNTTWYSDCHIGYTFNNPVVTKLSDGTWVVMVTSGYNNVNSPVKTGDGKGYLYVLRAYDGKILYKIATAAGTSGQPSGLNHIAVRVDSTLVNNTALHLYAGDLLGNLWRFDVNDTIGTAGREAELIGTAKTSSGTAQPISTRPELAMNGSAAFVMFGTGKMLGTDDLTDTQTQSIYGVVDPLTSGTAYANLRTSLRPLVMTQSGSGADAIRTVACVGTTAECNASAGWRVDLPDSGERVNVDIKLQLGTLVVASNVPQSSACTVGGFSWLNYVNYATGMAVANSTGGKVSQKLSDSLAVGLNIVRLPDGRTVVITTTSDAKQTTIGAPFDTPSPTGKRISWREIPQ